MVEVKDCCRFGGVIDMFGIEKIVMGYDGGIVVVVFYSWEIVFGKFIVEVGFVVFEVRMVFFVLFFGLKGVR